MPQTNNCDSTHDSGILSLLFINIVLTGYPWCLRELRKQNDKSLAELLSASCKIAHSLRRTLKIRSSLRAVRFLRKLSHVRSTRINVRINNSLCSSRLKRELYQYSDRKSAIHCPRERTHHRRLALLNLPIPDELFLFSSPLV